MPTAGNAGGREQCRLWLDGLVARGVVIVVPEIADYEVRREFTRVNATRSLHRLGDLISVGGLSYLLSLARTRVSGGGVLDLQRALPRTSIFH